MQNTLGIDIPTECWKSHTKIYLDFTCKQPIYVIEVIDGNLRLKKDNRKHKDNVGVVQKKFKQLISMNNNKLNRLERESVKFLSEYISEFKNEKFVIAHSSGKDSVVLDNIFRKVKDLLSFDFDWVYNFSNTTNETADTYKFIKQNLPKEKTNILSPEVGYYQWIKSKNYFVPSVMVRNCCSTYKEGQLSRLYDVNTRMHTLLGVRSSESSKRKNYVMIMDREFRTAHFGKDSIPESWTNVAPILNWTDEDVWLYTIREKLEVNRQYRIGYPRVGCLICPYQHNYSDVLTKEYYPTMWKRWEDILEKNYESTEVEKRLKWSIDEWKHGKWKNSVSKETELLSNRKTQERVELLADIKGISAKLASRYWNKTCACGKKLNTDEVALNLKLFGRGVSSSKMVCSKCYQKENQLNRKEYSALVKRFRDEGCSLF